MLDVQQIREVDSFPLIDLSYVPLLRIMRFLDEKSLRQTQLVCKSLFSFIDEHRKKMVAINIHQVFLRRVWNSFNTRSLSKTEVFIEVEIKKARNSGGPMKVYFPINIDSQKELEGLNGVLVLEKRINREDTFCKWISTKFTNVQIGKLKIYRMHLNENEVSSLEQAFQKNKTRADEIELLHSIYIQERVDRLVRFIMLFAPERMTVFERDLSVTRLLMTPFFLERISSLKHFSNLRIPEDIESIVLKETSAVPADFFKFPPSLWMGPGLLLTTSNVRRALREWTRNRLIIDNWEVIVDKYDNEELFSADIGLSYELEKKSQIRIKNCIGQELLVRKCVGKRNVCYSFVALEPPRR